MKKLILVLLYIIVPFAVFAQQAADYFPAQTGYTWFYKNIALDSMNNPVEASTYYQIDSFAVQQDYEGKPAFLSPSRTGLRSTVYQSPNMDTNFVNIETSNIWVYVKSIDAIDSLMSGDLSSFFKGWYNTYRLAQSTSSSYTIFSKDTTMLFDSSLTLKFIIDVTGRRFEDETIETGAGTFTAKKFLLKSALKAQYPGIPISYPVFTLNDTVWIAPGNYIVKDVTGSTPVDLSLFGYPAFYIPGYIKELLAFPPVMIIDPLSISVPWQSGEDAISVKERDNGSLTWSAEVTSGGSWLSLQNNAGTEADSVWFTFDKNDNLIPREGIITITSETALNSPQVVTVTQERGTTSVATQGTNIPAAYSLAQNYPNPFNPATTIKYAVPSYSYVSLKIYNILGVQVAQIAGGNKAPGYYEISFNPAKYNLSSGIYFYRLEAGKYNAIKKMIYMK